MDDKFNDNIPEEQSEEQSGEISGFDSAHSSFDESTPKVGSNDNIDVNSDGYYTKSHSDIIQDDVTPTPDGQYSYSPDGHYDSDVNNSSNNTPPHNPPFTSGYSYQGGNQYYGNPPVKTEKKRYSTATVIIASVLAAIIGALSGVGSLVYLYPRFIANNSDNNSGYSGPASNVNINIDKTVESVVEAVAEKVSPSVVGIRTTTSVMSFFGGSSEATGEGSGVIYSSDGYIITNYHVIENVAKSTTNSKIEVFLNNDTEKSYEAKIIGYHISSDLAVIKINAKGLKAVTIADSDKLNVGQYVIAIGCPGGLEFMGSVTYGVISGLNRVVSTSSGITLIQTDAAINPGNSGGAMLNTSGELIGINSSKIVAEEYEGMGFAIPSNTVVEKCEQIIQRKDKAEPYVGIAISEKYTPEVLEYYGFPVGAVVMSVDKDSPAYNKGIRRGDIITEFDGKKISNYTLFSEYLHDAGPDTTVKIKLYRSGKYYSTDLKIESNNALD